MNCGKPVEEKQESCIECGKNQLSNLIVQNSILEKNAINPIKEINNFTEYETRTISCPHCKKEFGGPAQICPSCGCFVNIPIKINKIAAITLIIISFFGYIFINQYTEQKNLSDISYKRQMRRICDIEQMNYSLNTCSQIMDVRFPSLIGQD
jgi:hypothetical protein